MIPGSAVDVSGGGGGGSFSNIKACTQSGKLLFSLSR